jgi:sterol desaturase/sphingolipid hydroxylase (fatty acid hydroxylase superfamily)
MPWSFISAAVCFLVFGTLARFFPCNPEQPRFINREMVDDALYWGFGLLVYGEVTVLLIRLAVADNAEAMNAIVSGRGWAAALPVWAQVVIILLATDIAQYWLHRALHHPWLWPFHAIHHSPREVTWSTTYRVHPVNWLIYIASIAVLTRLLGFAPAAFAVIAPVNMAIGALVHANLNWTFGPLRHLLASPVFHRWHHSLDPAVRDKHFAPTFPVLDLIFGTFHMPKGRLPETYGAAGVPDNFLPQMIWPFQAIAARFRRPQAA